MTMTTDEEQSKQRIDELSRRCANDMAALLAGRPRLSINSVSVPEKNAEDADVHRCSARELEWLGPVVTLRPKPARRASDQEQADIRLWVSDALSVLTLIPRPRYYLTAEPEASGARDVYPVSDMKAARVPYELRLRNIALDGSQSRGITPDGSQPRGITRDESKPQSISPGEGKRRKIDPDERNPGDITPYEIRLRDIQLAWFHRAPSPAAARSSAPSRGARPARTRLPRR